jgi:effector-binding domain-containing protein
MTAPVTQTPEAGDWTVRFLMPAGRSTGDLPAPAGDVRLVELPEARVAAIRFSGRWTDANFDRAEATLAAWLEARGLTPAGPPTYAYYNDPFTPAFLRRNEVLAPLAD